MPGAGLRRSRLPRYKFDPPAPGARVEQASITAKEFSSPLIEGPGRSGPPESETLKQSTQQFFWLDYGDKLGFMDFTGDQYFSWVRAHRVLVRGERGEIQGNKVSYLADYLTPIRLTLLRHEAGLEGNLEGEYLKGLQLGERMVYSNPLAPATLPDDEIAVGTCLLRMARYVETGEDFYPLAEACQDHYLNLMCRRALEEGRAIETERQAWAPAH